MVSKLVKDVLEGAGKEHLLGSVDKITDKLVSQVNVKLSGVLHWAVRDEILSHAVEAGIEKGVTSSDGLSCYLINRGRHDLAGLVQQYAPGVNVKSYNCTR